MSFVSWLCSGNKSHLQRCEKTWCEQGETKASARIPCVAYGLNDCAPLTFGEMEIGSDSSPPLFLYRYLNTRCTLKIKKKYTVDKIRLVKEQLSFPYTNM